MAIENKNTHLTADNINGLDPFFFKNPMLDYPFEITDDGCVKQVHISPSVPSNKFIDNVPIKVSLLDVIRLPSK